MRTGRPKLSYASKREPVIHELKVWAEYFGQVKRLEKTSELRLDDRNYMIGDILILKEWQKRKKQFTGEQVKRRVTQITRLAHWFPEDVVKEWVILHMQPYSDFLG